MRMANQDPKKTSKGQLAFIIFTNILIFATLGVIIYEMKNKDMYTYSYLLLGLVFTCMGINQYIYYRNNKIKKFLIMTFVYGIIGIVVSIFALNRII